MFETCSRLCVLSRSSVLAVLSVLSGLFLLLASPEAALADAPAKPAPTDAPGEKRLSGMSIVGNDEAPKSLVIVPWKSSALGDALGVPRSLELGRQPVDRAVFLRELTYYEIRTAR